MKIKFKKSNYVAELEKSNMSEGVFKTKGVSPYCDSGFIYFSENNELLLNIADSSIYVVVDNTTYEVITGS